MRKPPEAALPEVVLPAALSPAAVSPESVVGEGVSSEPAPERAIVAFGGGTGMACLLSGLKSFTRKLTAIVTVTDNGGSSGRLRREFDMVPPGDIRNCLVALADGEPLLGELLQYRFDESMLSGHSLGNLLITALTRITGSFDKAVRELNRLLVVRGKVLPATGSKVSLIAHHPDGTKTTGEVQVVGSGKPIERIEMRPRVGRAAPDVIAAIREADLIIFGPGSLFTSVIPNLLVPGIREAVRENPRDKIYVANIMTQPGETIGLDLAAHLRALETHAGGEFITGLVVHDGPIPAEMLARYAHENATPVVGLEAVRKRPEIKIASGDLLDPNSTVLRHQSARLARNIIENFAPELKRAGVSAPALMAGEPASARK
ncbi:MAG: uridine diphosphate-N-acetylglucosamine-binding protein YvcK [Planctomycetota bacterium]